MMEGAVWELCLEAVDEIEGAVEDSGSRASMKKKE